MLSSNHERVTSLIKIALFIIRTVLWTECLWQLRHIKSTSKVVQMIRNCRIKESFSRKQACGFFHSSLRTKSWCNIREYIEQHKCIVTLISNWFVCIMCLIRLIMNAAPLSCCESDPSALVWSLCWHLYSGLHLSKPIIISVLSETHWRHFKALMQIKAQSDHKRCTDCALHCLSVHPPTDQHDLKCKIKNNLLLFQIMKMIGMWCDIQTSMTTFDPHR